MSTLPAVPFSYETLPPEVAEAARKAAERIKVRLMHTAEQIVRHQHP